MHTYIHICMYVYIYMENYACLIPNILFSPLFWGESKHVCCQCLINTDSNPYNSLVLVTASYTRFFHVSFCERRFIPKGVKSFEHRHRRSNSRADFSVVISIRSDVCAQVHCVVHYRHFLSIFVLHSL